MKNTKVLHVVRKATGGMLSHVRQVAGCLSKKYEIYTAGPEEVAPGNANRHFNLEIGDGWSFNDFQQARVLAGIMNKEKIDLLHLHSTKAFFVGALASTMTTLPAVVVSFHNFVGFASLRGWKKQLILMLGKLLKKKEWHTIAVSEALATEIRDNWGLAENKISVVYNGLGETPDLGKLDQKQCRMELGLPFEGLIVGSLGRMIPGKGFEVLLEAFAALLKELANNKNNTIYLAIGGDGPGLEPLKQKTAQLGLEGKCIFLGHVEKKWSFLKSLDLYVQPSLNEGLGIALLEALWAGLPAIGSNVGGIPEVLGQGSCGLLVPPAETLALKESMRSLIENHDLGKALSEAGQKRVNSVFTEKSMIQRIDDIYQHLLDKNKIYAQPDFDKNCTDCRL